MFFWRFSVFPVVKRHFFGLMAAKGPVLQKVRGRVVCCRWSWLEKAELPGFA